MGGGRKIRGGRRNVRIRASRSFRTLGIKMMVRILRRIERRGFGFHYVATIKF